jgi:hypothetical protein
MDVGTIILNKNSNGIVKTYKIYNNNDGICLKIDTSSEAAVTQTEQEATLPATQTETPVQQEVNQEEVTVNTDDKTLDTNDENPVRVFLNKKQNEIKELYSKLNNIYDDIDYIEDESKSYNRIKNAIQQKTFIDKTLSELEEDAGIIDEFMNETNKLIFTLEQKYNSRINTTSNINNIIPKDEKELQSKIDKNISKLDEDIKKLQSYLFSLKHNLFLSGGKRRKTYKKKEKKSIRQNKKNPTKLIIPRIKKTIKNNEKII